jgi:Protein of unknown function (DUF3096)
LILIVPRLLSFIVAIYLIIVGLTASTPFTTSSGDGKAPRRAQISGLASASGIVAALAFSDFLRLTRGRIFHDVRRGECL